MNAGQTPMGPLKLSGGSNSAYGDGDIPEIDLPGTADTIPSIPEECPGRGMEFRS